MNRHNISALMTLRPVKTRQVSIIGSMIQKAEQRTEIGNISIISTTTDYLPISILCSAFCSDASATTASQPGYHFTNLTVLLPLTAM